MRPKAISIALVMIMVLGSTIIWNDASSIPTRANYHGITGFIGGLTPQNVGSFRASLNQNFSASQTNGSTPPPVTYGPYVAVVNYDLSYTISVPVDPPIDPRIPWDLIYPDRYGWNESNNGKSSVSPPAAFYWTNSSAQQSYNVDNGSAQQPMYTPGVLGGLKLHIVNGSSMAPLPGVPFFFPKHPGHSTMASGNVTDANGDVTFANLQLGLDTDNKVAVEFQHPHFSTADSSGKMSFPVHAGVVTTYNVVLKEKPLVKSVVPANGILNNTDKDKVKIEIWFNGLINKTSVRSSTIWMEEEGGTNVPVTYSSQDNALPATWTTLKPISDLKYNTSYTVFVDTGITDPLGGHPLWRMFSFGFRTWKVPAQVQGKVTIFGTTGNAPVGTTVVLDGQTTVSTVAGAFSFTVKEDVSHTLQSIGPTVGGIEEYMYTGMTTPAFTLKRGDNLSINNLFVFRVKTVSIAIDVIDESDEPMPGVNVTHIVTGASVITDQDGRAVFDDIKANFNHQFWLTLVNYAQRIINVSVGDSDGETFTAKMNEMPLPINITARDGVEIDLVEDAIVAVDSFFVLSFRSSMNAETMGTVNIKLLDSKDAPVDITITNETQNKKRWFMIPKEDLDYGASYTLFVSRYVAYQNGDNPLWRDEVIRFSTESLLDSSISGRVTINGKGIESLPFKVMSGTEVLAQSETTSNGAFFLNVHMRVKEISGAVVVVSGADHGLSDGTSDPFTLKTNEATDNIEVEMSRLVGWVNVTYKKDEMGRMVRTAPIFVVFNKVLDSAAAGFAENFTLGNVDLIVTATTDGKGAIVQPMIPLEYDKEYVLSVSMFQDTEYHKELRFDDGLPALIRGDTYSFRTELGPLNITMQSPAGTLLDAVPLKEKIVLRFSDSVKVESIEDNTTIKGVQSGAYVSNLKFDWRDADRAVEISHEDFKPTQAYRLDIPIGPYGKSGARLRENFTVQFMTAEGKDISLVPLPSLPLDIIEPSQMTLHLSNPKGFPILVVISYKLKDSTLPYTELANLTLAALEPDRAVVLDFSDFAVGQYEIHIWVKDPAVPESILNDYPLFLTIKEKKDSPGPSGIIVVIVIVLLVAVVAAVGVFIYMQTRKKEEGEVEVREEFECPECHHTVGVDDSVCPNCGAEFEEEAYKCPKCGHMLDPDDEECGECGYDFSEQEKMEIDTDDYEVDDSDEDEEVEELVEMEE